MPFKGVKFATDITDLVLARQEAERVSAMVDKRLDKILNAVVSADEQTTSVAAASTQRLNSAAQSMNNIVDVIQEIASNLMLASDAVTSINTNIDSISGAIGSANNYAEEGTKLYRSFQKNAS